MSSVLLQAGSVAFLEKFGLSVPAPTEMAADSGGGSNSHSGVEGNIDEAETAVDDAGIALGEGKMGGMMEVA